MGDSGEPLADRARPGTGTTALGDTVASGTEAGRPAGRDADGTPRPDPTRGPDPGPDPGPGVVRPAGLDADGTLLAAASVRLAGRTAPTGGDAPAPRAPSPGTPTGPAREAPPPATARRPPFRLGHRPALDGIRGLAMVLVLVFHLGVIVWPDARTWLVRNGYVGVDLFFVLSGFLITSLLLGELDHRGRIDVRGFLWRRVVRLVPALLVVLAVGLVAALAGYGPRTAGELLAIDATTLTLITNWFFPEHFIPEMGQVWSIAVEGQFYLVWSLVVAAVVAGVRRRPREVLLGLATLGIVAVAVTRAVRFEAGDNQFLLYLQTPSRLDGPLVGAVAGVTYASGWLDRVRPRAATAMTVLGLAGIGTAALVLDPYVDALFVGGFTLVALLGAMVVTGAVLLPAGRLTRVLSARPLVTAGTVSYSVFLWHVPLFVVIERDLDALPLGLQLALGLTGSLALGTLSHRYVERPLIHRARRHPPAPT
jgi:peptidoglycan/LPS O-acetylase OafA/YrhL